MEILYQYKRERRKFGRHLSLDTSEPVVLLDVKPQSQLQRLHIRRNPVTVKVDSSPSYSAHEVNTEIKGYTNKGMLHLEGGWPRDVNPDDLDSKTRFQKKEEKSDRFLVSLKKNSDVMDVFLRQNVALDVYEDYFSGKRYDLATIFRRSMAESSATILTVLKDPCTDFKRAALDISWFLTDGSKVAVAYSVLHSQHIPEGLDYRSCVWDIRNPNAPELFLAPSSPLTCLEYNQRDTPYIISGASNGAIYVFDTRRGSQPIDYSLVENSHRGPVYSVKWIQSKSNSECVSISTDGQILFWDARSLGAPIERHELLQKANPRTGLMYDGMLGPVSLNYDTNYSTSKFLIGTEQGYVANWNRKTKRADKIERAFSGHHGPICAVERNPFLSKYFLSVGDWTARIFCDDLRKPVMETKYHDTYLTQACWSNSRPGIFFTTKMDGSMDVWDIMHDHSKPMLSVNISPEPLYSLRVYNDKYLACGDGAGSIYYVELSGDLSGFMGEEKQSQQEERQMILEMLEREYAREKALEARRADLENLAKQQSKISAQPPPPPGKPLQQPSYENGSDEDDPEIREITQDYFRHLEEEDQHQHKETSSHRL